jgi:hypothetical protein
VVESAAHRLTRLPLGSVARADGFSHTTQRPVTEIAAGALELVVTFEPPPGQKVDDRFGPASQLVDRDTTAADPSRRRPRHRAHPDHHDQRGGRHRGAARRGPRRVVRRPRR